MKILFAAATFATNISGVQRHVFNVVRCLLPRPEITQVDIAVAPWQKDLLERAGLPRSVKLIPHVAKMEQTALSRNIWYYRELPKLASELGSDLVHVACPMPLDGRAFQCPTVVTLHDLYPYEIPINFGFPKFIFNRFVLWQCLRAVDGIACVSEATAARLRRYLPASIWRKSVRIYNCVEPERQVSAESPIPAWAGEPFLLCIAQHRRNKNLPLVIKAFKTLLNSGRLDANAYLVIVGIRGPETTKIHRLVREAGLERRVAFLEGLSEGELQWCYRNCAVLLAPSITEGFDLPVAEGILAGCRIVCSDIEVHREIGKEFCKFIQLGTDEERRLADSISEILREPKPLPALLRHLSGPVLAQQYLALYRRLRASANSAELTDPAEAFPVAQMDGASIAPGNGLLIEYGGAGAARKDARTFVRPN